MKIRISIIAMAVAILTAPCLHAGNKKKPVVKETVEIEVRTSPGSNRAAELLEDEEALEMVNTMLNRYTTWESVTFNGKIRSDKLPMSPTIRIYAVKGKLLQISLRAPLLGELGRIEVTPDEFLAINKWKKTYVRESARHISEKYPNLLDDIQSLLLGRVVVLGKGELSMSTLSDILLVRANNGEWALAPREMPIDGNLQYGYVVGQNGRTSLLYGQMSGRNEFVDIRYDYPDNTMQMTVTFRRNDKDTQAQLDFSSIKWGGERMNAVNISNYTQMSLAEFIRNIK